MFSEAKKIFGSLLHVALAEFAESIVSFDVDIVSQGQSGIIGVLAGATEEFGRYDFGSDTQTEEDNKEENDKDLEDTNETGVAFLESINAHDRAKDNDQICSDKDPKDGLSFLGIIEEDFAVSEAVDGDAGHAETDNKDDKGSESGDSFEAAEHHIGF